MYSERGMSTGLIVGIVALALILGGGWYLMQSNDSSPTVEDKDAMMEDDKAMEGESDAMKDGDSMMEGEHDGDAMMEDGDAMMDGDSGAIEDSTSSVAYTGTVLEQGASPLIKFSETDYEAAKKNGDIVVLWYYANWCPTCKIEQQSIKAAVKEFDKSGLVIFRVNINDSETGDAEEQTARDFGVAYRHTKVALQNGERVLKSTEVWKKNHWLENLNNLLN